MGVSSDKRAAANSSASGSPSRRWQISTMGAAFSLLRAKSGLTSRARSTNRVTAGICTRCSRSGRCAGSGNSSGGIGTICSSLTRKGSRLVTSSLSRGASSRYWVASGAAEISCSALSITSNTCLGRRYSSSRSSSDPLPLSDTPSARATVGTTSLGSLSEASEMNATPSVNWGTRSAATCTATRVLPTPPGPVSVTRPTSSRCSRACACARSCSRSMSRLRGMGSAASRMATGVLGVLEKRSVKSCARSLAIRSRSSSGVANF